MSKTINKIPIAKPFIGEAEAAAASRVILSGWVTQGPEVAAFEAEFAEEVGAKYACAVSNCTTALHLALLAVGVQPEDEVITVSHSYIATANSIRYCGATPVFVDIEPQTYNINPLLIESVISDRTRAILIVHQMGMPCDLKAIINIARRYNLPVIEDAACAIGSEILWDGKWEKIGKPHGDIACFSFHPRKVITTGDGGMITTSNPEWDRQFRLWRQHGMSVPDTVRHGAKQVIFESYPMLGYNYRMTDIQAAVGREQLKRLPEIVSRRRYLAARYQELLADIPGLELPTEPEWAKSNWQSYCVRLPNGCNQVQVMQGMLDAGVSTRRGIMCAHREPAYKYEKWSCGIEQTDCSCQPGNCDRLIESEQAQDRAIILPLFHQMSESEQDYSVKVLRRLVYISIAANTTYIVSVNANSYYVATNNGLATTITNGDLSAVADGSNGVYNTTPANFPTQSYQNSNYFRDIVFTTNQTPNNNLGTVTINGTATQNQILTATVGDADGLTGSTINYQWQQSNNNGTTWTSISDAINQTLVLGQAQVNNRVRVTATYTDTLGSGENPTSAATNSVANVNDIGIATINGTIAQGGILTANVADADSLTGITINYQWQQLNNNTWTNITGETNQNLTLDNSLVGKQVRFNATYADALGANENIFSAASNPISAAVLESLFTSQTPTQTNLTDGTGSAGDYELGMEFRTVQAGQISALRYYKAASETGTHVGKIWSVSGQLLGSVTFSNETAFQDNYLEV